LKREDPSCLSNCEIRAGSRFLSKFFSCIESGDVSLDTSCILFQRPLTGSHCITVANRVRWIFIVPLVRTGISQASQVLLTPSRLRASCSISVSPSHVPSSVSVLMIPVMGFVLTTVNWIRHDDPDAIPRSTMLVCSSPVSFINQS
jgi:hypothetical protein